MKIKPILTPLIREVVPGPGDKVYLTSLGFSQEQICKLFGVPVELLGASTAARIFANAETQDAAAFLRDSRAADKGSK